MTENTQPAQTGLEKETVTGTKCSICQGKRLDKREAINKALGKGLSHKDIELMTGVPSRTVGNHAQHLPAIYRESRQLGILSQPIDHQREIHEQFRFAKDLREASRDWLRDPEHADKITLIPRADEVTVIYFDPKDTNRSGEPKRKKENLQAVINRLEGVSCENPIAFVQTADIREFALKAINTADTVLDKIAKLEGLYTKEKENPVNKNTAEYWIWVVERVAKQTGNEIEAAYNTGVESNWIPPHLRDEVRVKLLGDGNG